jgi:hypothetical protein
MDQLVSLLKETFFRFDKPGPVHNCITSMALVEVRCRYG